jgi:hypothetical protein
MQGVLETLEWVKDNILLVKEDAKKHGASFGERTPGEVLKSKQTNYINTCVDLTMATAVLLREKGLRPVIVAQERVHGVTKKPVVHFMLEVIINREVHTIDYKRGKVAVIYKGHANPKKAGSQKHLAFHRFETKSLSRGTRPFDFFGFSNMSKIHTVFPHCSEKNIAALTKVMERANKTNLFKRVKNANKRVVRR